MLGPVNPQFQRCAVSLVLAPPEHPDSVDVCRLSRAVLGAVVHHDDLIFPSGVAHHRVHRADLLRDVGSLVVCRNDNRHRPLAGARLVCNDLFDHARRLTSGNWRNGTP